MSTLEYHPFTAVASTVLPPLHDHDLDHGDPGSDATISVFLKSMGEGSWTGTLCDLVESGTTDDRQRSSR